MTEVQIACIKRTPKLVGRGVHREVYGVGKFALKVEKTGEQNLKNLHERALKLLSLNLDLRKKLDFLPKFYGVILTAIRRKGKIRPAVVTFHEFIKPGPLYSLGLLRAAVDIIGRAGRKGLILDLKPSNFGIKKGRVYYLDEYGIGKGPIPPDVLEDFAKLLRFVKPKLRSSR
jgi:hypothetical protein